MKVILQKDVKNLGQAGDIVSVKKGYARHFLFPKKQAMAFTKGSAAQVQHRKTLILAKKKKALDLRQNLVEKLKDIELCFVKEADEAGRLFGSLTVFELSKELQNQGYEVDKKAIKMNQALKETGEHKVLLDFGSDMKTYISVQIQAVLHKSKKTPSA